MKDATENTLRHYHMRTIAAFVMATAVGAVAGLAYLVGII